jgi:hypothetical protein
MGASFDDIVKDYMLSFVEESEYSLNDHKNGAEFIIDLFGKIKGETAHGNENLQCLSENYLLEKIKLSGDEAQLLANRLMDDSPGSGQGK